MQFIYENRDALSALSLLLFAISIFILWIYAAIIEKIVFHVSDEKHAYPPTRGVTLINYDDPKFAKNKIGKIKIFGKIRFCIFLSSVVFFVSTIFFYNALSISSFGAEMSLQVEAEFLHWFGG